MNPLDSTPFKGHFAHSYRRRLLANGLAVVEVPLPHLHRGSIAIFFRAGSRFETPRDNGLTHFLEHMLFRGTTEHKSAFSVNLAVERLGGTLFAATAPDATELEMTLPRESLAEGIALLAEIATRPVFQDMEIERRVLLEEIREDLDARGKIIDIDLLSRARLWSGHPLGQPVTGPLHNATRFTADDLARHFRRSFVAQNAVVCLSGAFDPDELAPAIDRAFSAVPSGERTEPGSPPELGLGPSFLHVRRSGSQTQLRLAFHAPCDEDPDHNALSILMGILDDGMSTRLHRRIFDERGLAYSLGAELDAYADASALNIDAATSHENAVELAEELLALVADLALGGAEESEVEKAVRRAVWALESFLDDPIAMAGWYGEQELVRPPPLLKTRAEELLRISRADVLRVARRVFTAKNLHVTAVGDLGRSACGAIRKAAQTRVPHG